MLLELEVTATSPSGPVTQVLTLMPALYVDPSYDKCNYGVSIVYKGSSLRGRLRNRRLSQ